MKVCKDEVIAIVEVTEASLFIRRPKTYNTTFVGLDAFNKHKSRYNSPILIVTESPHIEEFRVNGITDFVTGMPVQARPVNGVTGQNILNLLPELLMRSDIQFSKGHYPVILMNALQEQCSEGKDTLISRTRNFIQLWNTKSTFLEERLKSIQPIVALCSCTVGDFRLSNGSTAYGSRNRADFENNFVQLLQGDFNLRQVNHRSSYNFMGALDLSGLVLDALDRAYRDSHVRIFKTTHPAAWGRQAPALRRYNKTQYYYES